MFHHNIFRMDEPQRYLFGLCMKWHLPSHYRSLKDKSQDNLHALFFNILQLTVGFYSAFWKSHPLTHIHMTLLIPYWSSTGETEERTGWKLLLISS